MGLVEDDEFVGLDLVSEPGEHSISRQGIDANDEAVTQRSREGIIVRTSLPLTMRTEG